MTQRGNLNWRFMMEKSLVRLFAAVLASSLSVALCAAEKATDQKPESAAPSGSTRIIEVETLSVSAKVMDLDAPNNSITLIFPDESVKSFKFCDEVANQNGLKPGDQIRATIAPPTVILIKKAGSSRDGVDSTKARLSPRGDKSRIFNAETEESSGKVAYVSTEKRWLNLTAPEKMGSSFRVDPEVNNLSAFKEGDEVVVRHTGDVIFEIVVEPASTQGK